MAVSKTSTSADKSCLALAKSRPCCRQTKWLSPYRLTVVAIHHFGCGREEQRKSTTTTPVATRYTQSNQRIEVSLHMNKMKLTF